MNRSPEYGPEPSLDEVAALRGWVLLDFGTAWCGHCQAALSLVDGFVAAHGVVHIRAEDGPKRPLGRGYRITLWPTLVLLLDGVELARTVRPKGSDDLAPLLTALAGRHRRTALDETAAASSQRLGVHRSTGMRS